MSMNLSAKLDSLQRGDRHLETTVALTEIRCQLQELTKSVESCQSEVSEVKRDMVAIKHELDTVQQVKEEIEELREYVDRLEEQTHRRKLRLLEQVRTCCMPLPLPHAAPTGSAAALLGQVRDTMPVIGLPHLQQRTTALPL